MASTNGLDSIRSIMAAVSGSVPFYSSSCMYRPSYNLSSSVWITILHFFYCSTDVVLLKMVTIFVFKKFISVYFILKVSVSECYIYLEFYNKIPVRLNFIEVSRNTKTAKEKT